ncbi:750_t:CDS:1 [Paraglomus brasilianum]|uniref:750_t:CDS:1 n=1 Tax=Paraglomus brasilianum TaxID=144538 RepID=A0A9N9GJY0_9GLOM|nr:750_t:CDS:1 [Paraglomus brasilianum]
MSHPVTINNKLGHEQQQSTPSSPSSVLASSPNHLQSSANLHPSWSPFKTQPGLLSPNAPPSSNVSTILPVSYHSGSAASLSIPNSTNEHLIKEANGNIETKEIENVKLFSKQCLAKNRKLLREIRNVVLVILIFIIIWLAVTSCYGDCYAN